MHKGCEVKCSEDLSPVSAPGIVRHNQLEFLWRVFDERRIVEQNCFLAVACEELKCRRFV